MNSLFYQLIRVAIGTQDSLSRLPSAREWGKLYKMAQKQSLVGVCFAGLKRLGADADEGFARIGMSKDLYFDWMGNTFMIQQKNGIVNQQCAELQAKLSADGLRSCILKGQGVAQLYPEDLRMLRQSGDIDAWVDALKKDVVDWATSHSVTGPAGYLHVGCRIFKDTEVELHYRPTYMRSLRHNRSLQRFCEEHMKDWTERDGIIVPSWEFDVVYQLSHIYRHLFGIGVGLRQLMDYYFVLTSNNAKYTNTDLLKHLGLYGFSGAVMYVMREVFGMDEKHMICVVDEKRGKMLLKQVMQTGNFGKMDKEQKEARRTTTGSVKYKLGLT